MASSGPLPVESRPEVGDDLGQLCALAITAKVLVRTDIDADDLGWTSIVANGDIKGPLLPVEQKRSTDRKTAEFYQAAATTEQQIQQ